MPGSRTTQKPFESYVISEGLKIFPDFKLYKDQMNFYMSLFLYFTKDGLFTLNNDYSMKKGLLISGKIGSGKTTAMRLFKNYKMIASRHIIREFNIDGMKILDKYGRYSFKRTTTNACDYEKPITMCFDDLGLEDTNSKLYGNSANVMADIFLDRYDMFQNYGMITHAITNLDVDNLKEIYGDRMVDRFKEMMNLIICPGASLRK